MPFSNIPCKINDSHHSCNTLFNALISLKSSKKDISQVRRETTHVNNFTKYISMSQQIEHMVPQFLIPTNYRCNLQTAWDISREHILALNWHDVLIRENSIKHLQYSSIWLLLCSKFIYNQVDFYMFVRVYISWV